ncbi:DnaJ C-terminal domain-containing protein [Ralstonia solanacearum]|uniref:DnaJ C-terminal domain-containing protein n=1 Tax=Ralstonia solanacearum TaxID=305 RepID=UPI0021753A96|nr:DnaJ C-terminal domain-containing protein [Ralstonia solanacearum]
MQDVFATVRVPLATAFAGGVVVARVNVLQMCNQCYGKGKCHSPLFRCSACDGTGKTAPFGRWGSGTCSACDGDGRSKSRCWGCNGSGASFAPKDIEIHIPPRTGPGVVLFVKGAGHTGIDGGVPGDAQVTVQIDWWPSGYQLTGLAIEGPAEVDCLAAVLGGPADVTVLGSTVTVDIPLNVRSGTWITVPRAGLTDGFGHAGDLRLNVVLHVLNPVDANTRERLRAILDKAAGEST